MSERARGCCCGIALLEVLVALTVIGLGVTATLKVIGVCTRNESRATKQMVAAELASHQIAVLRSQGDGLPVGEQRGSFGPPHDGYTWEATIEGTGQNLPFRLVRISIFARIAPTRPMLIMQSLL